jgi:hypothetical protein
MAKIYADLLITGKKQFNQVPAQIQEAVKQVLKDFVVLNTITAEKYEEIVGEPYVG